MDKIVKNEDAEVKKIEHLRLMNERIYEQLSYAETKNGILLGLLAAAIGVFVGVLASDANIHYGLKIYLAVVTIAFSVSLISCLLSFFPNLKTLENSPNPNLYFYGNLANFKTTDEYDESLDKMQNEAMHLEAQNIHVSRIIMRKHKLFAIAINLFFAGVALPVYLAYIGWRFVKKRKSTKGK